MIIGSRNLSCVAVCRKSLTKSAFCDIQLALSGINASRAESTSSILRADESILLVIPVLREIVSGIGIDGASLSKSGVGRVNSPKYSISPSGFNIAAPMEIIVSEYGSAPVVFSSMAVMFFMHGIVT